MKKLLLTIAACFMAASMLFGANYDGVKFVDSNDVVVIEVDSADYADLTTRIDTAYFPDAYGRRLAPFNYYLFTYGVADIDSTNYAVNGAVEADSGCYVTAMVNDSGHIGIFLETSYDGKIWSEIKGDSTIRTRFTADGDSVPRHLWLSVTNYMDPDSTIPGNLWRVRTNLYRDYDSTDAYPHDINDTVWLNDVKLQGFDYR